MSVFDLFRISFFSLMLCCNRGARFLHRCYYLPPLLLLSQRCEYRFSARLLYLMLVFHYRFVLALFHWIGRILFDLDSVHLPRRLWIWPVETSPPWCNDGHWSGIWTAGRQTERGSASWILTSPFLLALIPLSHPVFRADTDICLLLLSAQWRRHGSFIKV